MTKEEKELLIEKRANAYKEVKGWKVILDQLEASTNNTMLKLLMAKQTYETIDRELAFNDERFKLLKVTEKEVSINLTQDQVNRILAELGEGAAG